MRLALLTNFVPPYRLPVFKALRDRVGDLKILISTPMEKNRAWPADWSDLDVTVQKTWSITRRWKHERFTEEYELHVPYDTIAQLRRYRPDAILTAEFGARSMQAVMYGAATRVPVIGWATLTDHLEPSRGRARNVLRRGMVRGMRRIIVNGEAGARYIRSLGVADTRIARIPQAINLQPFLALPLPRENPRTLLCVGAVSELKNSHKLFAALRQLGGPVRLIVVGDGSLRAELQQSHLPPDVAVEWAGSVQYDDLANQYRRGGILVFPTNGDEWGLVVNEAMASGIPVLGSVYSQAVEEMVRDNVNGWSFRPDSVADITAALERALVTPVNTLHEMGRAARTTAMAITPENAAERILQAVQS